jgi:hypothetical protein
MKKNWHSSKKVHKLLLLLILSVGFLIGTLDRFWYYGTRYNFYNSQLSLYNSGKLNLSALQLTQLKANISAMSLTSYETGSLFIAVLVLFLVISVSIFFTWNDWSGTP